MNDAGRVVQAVDNAPPVLEARGLVKTFSDVGRNVEVLRGVELTVAKGDRIAIIGTSGSGKTTLLQLIGGLDQPTTGEVRVVGESMSTLRDSERGRLRNRALGFVYQFHHLLPEFTALENVAMRRVLEALGFVHEGTLQSFMPGPDGREDYAMYAVTRELWEGRPPA